LITGTAAENATVRLTPRDQSVARSLRKLVRRLVTEKAGRRH